MYLKIQKDSPYKLILSHLPDYIGPLTEWRQTELKLQVIN